MNSEQSWLTHNLRLCVTIWNNYHLSAVLNAKLMQIGTNNFTNICFVFINSNVKRIKVNIIFNFVSVSNSEPLTDNCHFIPETLQTTMKRHTNRICSITANIFVFLLFITFYWKEISQLVLSLSVLFFSLFVCSFNSVPFHIFLSNSWIKPPALWSKLWIWNKSK